MGVLVRGAGAGFADLGGHPLRSSFARPRPLALCKGATSFVRPSLLVKGRGGRKCSPYVWRRHRVRLDVAVEEGGITA